MNERIYMGGTPPTVAMPEVIKGPDVRPHWRDDLYWSVKAAVATCVGGAAASYSLGMADSVFGSAPDEINYLHAGAEVATFVSNTAGISAVLSGLAINFFLKGRVNRQSDRDSQQCNR